MDRRIHRLLRDGRATPRALSAAARGSGRSQQGASVGNLYSDSRTNHQSAKPAECRWVSVTAPNRSSRQSLKTHLRSGDRAIGARISAVKKSDEPAEAHRRRRSRGTNPNPNSAVANRPSEAGSGIAIASTGSWLNSCQSELVGPRQPDCPLVQKSLKT